MSILSGFLKTKKHRKMADGNYKLQSEWTSASTVEMADGNTAETNLGAIQGITDSLTATSSNIALSAKAGNNLQGQIDTVNSNLSDITESVKGAKIVDVSNYNSTNNTMNCEADGYVKLVADGEVNNTTRAYLMPSNTAIASAKVTNKNVSVSSTFYVKKGMELYFVMSETQNSNVRYFPLSK